MEKNLTLDDIRKEAERCIKCKNPQCVNACPAGNKIPEFIEAFLKDDIEKAAELILSRNPLSVICSRICPYEKQCQGKCIMGKKGDPVAISIIERYISDQFLERDIAIEREKQNQMVAIIGSGPSGLTMAHMLIKRGYDITVFDVKDKVGGILRYGIPEFRLPRDIIEKIAKKLKRAGVKFRLNTFIGPVISIDSLFNDGYKAVFIGTGAWRPVSLGIKGESLGHVHFALDYLKSPKEYELGNEVVVIGGGNTAIDAARSAIKYSGSKVKILYRRTREEMTARDMEVREAETDGVDFEFLVSPLEITTEGVLCTKMKLGDPDESGRRRPVPAEGTEFLITADSIIIAVSQGPRSFIVNSTWGIEVNEKGLLLTNQWGCTTREGVFGCGDVVIGASTVVEAVKCAKITSETIENYLDNLKNGVITWPITLSTDR